MVLAKFLVSTGTLGFDRAIAERILSQKKSPKNEYERRLILYHAGVKGLFPWEGITWVLDLSPEHPREAIAALSAYFLAHIGSLPDGRIAGLDDALSLIRARYIGTPPTNADKLGMLLDLTPRQFEQLVEALYASMGYEAKLTPRQKDGGDDVLATNV